MAADDQTNLYGTWTPVASSMIDMVRYDAGQQLLFIKFKNGATYSYSGVDYDEVDSMMKDASVGSYFHDNIKDSYPTRRT